MTDNNEEFKGYHKFRADDGSEYGSFEVFYYDGATLQGEDVFFPENAWYWWACHPGCIPDSDPSAPFPTAEGAYLDAMEGTPVHISADEFAEGEADSMFDERLK